MTLTARIIQTLFAAIVLCFSSIAVQGQSQTVVGDSTINGVVVYSDTGRPLRHARITLLTEIDGWEQTAVSDLRGRFVFQNVPAGKCRLIVDAPGILPAHESISRNAVFGRHRRFPTQSELVTEVSVNGTDTVEVKLQAVRGGVITGRVVTDDDQPLINADVKLLRRENGKWVPESAIWSPYREQVAGERKTDAGGVYRIAGLRSGDYLVRVSEPVLGDDRIPGDEDSYYDGSFMVAYYPSATGVKDAQSVNVVEGSESKGIDIRMAERAPHTLTGTVTVGPDKMPATSVAVTIERSDEIGYTSTLEGSARTDEQGRWRFAGLPAGEYSVSIGGSVRIVSGEQSGWLETPRKRTTVRIHDKKINVLDTTLSFGAHVEGRAMLNGKPFDEEWGVYIGIDLDEKSASGKSAETESGFYPAGLRGKGMFEINGIAEGTYRFQMYIREADKAYVKSVTRKGVDLMQTPVKLTDGLSYDDVVISLATDFANVEGQIALAEKQPASDVVVIIAPANDVTSRFTSGPQTVQPDAQGKISFKSAPGEFLLAAMTMAQYKKIVPQFNYEYFEKNAAKFQRIKLRAGEKLKWGKIDLISLP